MSPRPLNVVTRVLLALAWIGCAAPFALAQVNPQELKETPVRLQADQITYDQNLSTVTASGNVEIVQGERTLLADQVTYNQAIDQVTASGNVVLQEPTGEVLFADYMELRNELKDGMITGIRVLLSDESRFAANSAEREEGVRTELNQAIYSPCKLCEDDPTKAPLWQVKASKVVHDSEANIIEYKHAVLEFYGIPVAYTPYFYHPDPTVERKTGLLAPIFGRSTALGLEATTPFYWAIAPHRDLTISPRFTTEEGVILGAEYRERTASGKFKLDGTITYTDERDDNNDTTGDEEFRGHARGEALFNIDNQWRWGFDFFRASDDTYLKRYDISDSDILTSRLFSEGFNGRNFAAANLYEFQDLRENLPQDEVPFILPLLQFQHIGEPEYFGGRFNLDANGLLLYRPDGTDSRRVSLSGGWQRTHIGPLGSVFNFTAQLRGDAYWVNDVADAADGTNSGSGNEFTGRFLPLGAAEWRYPLVRRGERFRQLIEPIASIVISPDGNNPDSIPNEDSVSVEFDDTNLFSLNRFPGLDRVETGSRATYGVRGGLYGRDGGFASFTVGQSLRYEDDNTFPGSSGLDDQLSDVVGRITIAPTDYLDYVFRMRVDPTDLKLRRTESYLTLGPEDYRLKVNYVNLARELAVDELTSREEINIQARAKITEHWSVLGEYRRDLAESEDLFAGGGVQYLDECFDMRLFVERKFTRDRDVEPTTNVTFRVRLKHFGS